MRGRAPLVLAVPLVLVVLLASGCSTGSSGPAESAFPSEPAYGTVDELFAAAGGEQWCTGELQVTLEPFIGNCGDPTGDSRVVLGVGAGGGELRSSVESARAHLVEDDQLLLVPSDPDREWGWQLRSRDRELLKQAQDRLGGVILATEDDVEEWLGE